MSRFYFFCSVLIFISFYSAGQEAQVYANESLVELEFMLGTWNGEGWIMMGREKKEFNQTEVIEPKAGQRLFLVDGIGYAKGDTLGDAIHKAFGIISYNEARGAVTMLAFTEKQGRLETELQTIGEKRLQWSFKNDQGGTIRFSEDFSQDGLWKEIGEYSRDGEHWYQFFEMKLVRQP